MAFLEPGAAGQVVIFTTTIFQQLHSSSLNFAFIFK